MVYSAPPLKKRILRQQEHHIHAHRVISYSFCVGSDKTNHFIFLKERASCIVKYLPHFILNSIHTITIKHNHICKTSRFRPPLYVVNDILILLSKYCFQIIMHDPVVNVHIHVHICVCVCVWREREKFSEGLCTCEVCFIL